MTFIDDNKNKLYRYVDPLGDENAHLACTICYHPLEEPITEPSCRNLMCKACLEEAINNSNQCPKCNKPIKLEDVMNQPQPLFLTKQLDNLKVLCLVCNSPTEIRRADFQNHLDNFCKTQCKLGCSELLTKCQVQSHNQICKKYPVKCDGKDLMCGWSGLREDKERHESNCPFLALEPVLSYLLKTIEKLNINSK